MKIAIKTDLLLLLLTLPILSSCADTRDIDARYTKTIYAYAHYLFDENSSALTTQSFKKEDVKSNNQQKSSRLKLNDALALSLKKEIDIDVYTGAHTIYFEWDEKKLPIKQIFVTDRTQKHPITYRADTLQHRWNWYISSNLDTETTYVYTLTLLLKNGKTKQETFSVTTRAKNTFLGKKIEFKIYDDIEGGQGGKDTYLAKHTFSKTMRDYGLHNSAMYWVDWFYEPIPKLSDSQSRLESKPNIQKLYARIKDDINSKIPHIQIEKKEGLVVLDIEHVPTIVEYVAREFSPYGAFVSKFIQTKEVKENGKKIVSSAIAKKLQAVQAVKKLLPHTPVGLWNSIVPWHRYHDNKKNHDYNALAKGVERGWRVNYATWHKDDSLIFKPYIDVIDYVMPLAYPMFELSTQEGKRKQEGYILSKFMELKRLNPDVQVIPSICPHYTEGWTKKSNLYHMPLNQETFSWYLELLFTYHERGMIDGIHIWADNGGTAFGNFPKEGWWKALLDFTKKHAID